MLTISKERQHDFEVPSESFSTWFCRLLIKKIPKAELLTFWEAYSSPLKILQKRVGIGYENARILKKNRPRQNSRAEYAHMSAPVNAADYAFVDEHSMKCSLP